jgi:glycosyltransferase involved in cell wall biosynthesis
MHPLHLSPDIQPYVSLLADALRREGVSLAEYRTIHMLRRPPDVIHFHWPEHVLSRPPFRRFVRGLLLLSTLFMARLRGSVLVVTAHNLGPHDEYPGWFGRWFLERFDRQADGVLILSRAAWPEITTRRPSLADGVVTHTRHGHFRNAYAVPQDPSRARYRFGIPSTRRVAVFAGQVRPYKGVPELLDAAQPLDIDVVVAGSCSDLELREQLEDRARVDPRIHLQLRHLRAEELVETIGVASVVALPYRAVLNSGSALLALSMDRRVLLPSTPTFRELQAEVGSAWVRLFSGTRLMPSDLAAALEDLPRGQPNLERYEWSEVAAATVAGYERTLRSSSSAVAGRDPAA